MNRWRGKVAVITGASSGIGEDIARRLVEEGLQVVGIARNVELVAENSTKLTEQPGGKLHALKCDVTNEDQVAQAFEWIKDNLGPVHILINNAGFVKENFFCDGDPKVWKQVLDTNLFGVALCSHAAVKQMREADVAGHIVNINSIAGHKVVNMTPNDYNMYAPSKHGVTAFTEVLRQELIHFKTKIKVSVVGLARRVEMIQEIADELIGKSGKLYARKCDVTDPKETIDNFKWIKDTLGPVHILINNAGYIKAESILEGNPDTWKTIMDTHVLASTLCSKEAIAQMRESNIAGHVILMNGILGHRITEQRIPIMNIYPCAKYGLTALQELLTQELRYFGTKIKVSTMSPGLVHKTEIFVKGNINFLKPELCEKFPHLLPEDVTNGIIYILSTPPHVQVYELILKPVGELF